MADYTLKRNDTWPPLKATLTDSNGAIDLTGATSVKIILKSKSVSPVVVVTGTCTMVTPASGIVQYPWVAGDTAVADTYDVEFEINWGGGKIQTVPNASSGNKTVEIDPDLENA